MATTDAGPKDAMIAHTHEEPNGTVVVTRGVPAFVVEHEEAPREVAYRVDVAQRLQELVLDAAALPGPNDVVDVDFATGRMRAIPRESDVPVTRALYAFRCPHGASGRMHAEAGHEFSRPFAIGAAPVAVRCVGHGGIATLVGGPRPLPEPPPAPEPPPPALFGDGVQADGGAAG